jgi:hypothetical protein
VGYAVQTFDNQHSEHINTDFEICDILFKERLSPLLHYFDVLMQPAGIEPAVQPN